MQDERREVVDHFRNHTNPIYERLQIEADLFDVSLKTIREILLDNGIEITTADYTKAVKEHDGSIEAIASKEEVLKKIAKYKEWERREILLQADLWGRTKASQARAKYYSQKIRLYEELINATNDDI